MSITEPAEDTTQDTINELLDSIRLIGFKEGRGSLRQSIMDFINANQKPEYSEGFRAILQHLLESFEQDDPNG